MHTLDGTATAIPRSDGCDLQHPWRMLDLLDPQAIAGESSPLPFRPHAFHLGGSQGATRSPFGHRLGDDLLNWFHWFDSHQFLIEP